MGQVLKIESDEAVSLARELAALTGESLEAIVIAAVRDRLEDERRTKARVDKVLELAAEIRGMMVKPLPPSDLSHLYDSETGLPV